MPGAQFVQPVGFAGGIGCAPEEAAVTPVSTWTGVKRSVRVPSPSWP
jgi:hypothetical protein